MRCSRLHALPPYPGGKRRLLGRIFRHLPGAAEAPVFVDPFLGGGAVSLMAKARGHRVICSDLAERSVIVGRALIENDRVTLTEADTLRFFVPHPDAGRFIRDNFAPDVLTTKHAAFLDNALVVARAARGPKRWLFFLLLLKYVLRNRPGGNFGAKTIVHQMEVGAWEGMNPHYIRDVLARTIDGHPKALVDAIRRQVNRGIFGNGQQNQVHQTDALEFIQKTAGDILYLDPPYAGTQAYETALRPLDEILAGRRLETERSRFSRKDGLQALAALLDQAEHFPVWAISYGNRETSLDDLVRLVEKFRPVQHAEAIRYAHCAGLAGREHRDRNRELLVFARRQDR
ncbi:MAG: DNA adenine methylase [Deltaproteobacteria bacterium]|nr:DNA adenine methylase [Deltaproteobacteria bacterium]